MKFRTDFVTNSSSSSFIVSIIIEKKDGTSISFDANGGTPECGRIDYFSGDACICLSPKQLANAKTIDEFIEILTDGVTDFNDWTEEEVKIFEKSNPQRTDIDFEGNGAFFDAYDFIEEIREKLKDVNEIAGIAITGEEHNYMEYNQTYAYDKESGEYVGVVEGFPFEKDGSSGGYISIPDEDECEIEYINNEEDEY